MDNNIAMTRVQPAPTPAVDATPRQPLAEPTAVAAPSTPPPPATADVPLAKGADLEAMAERVSELIGEFSRQAGRQLEFQVQSDSNRVVILVKSTDTGEVVRSIPPEEVQRLAETLAAGEPALIDLRA